LSRLILNYNSHLYVICTDPPEANFTGNGSFKACPKPNPKDYNKLVHLLDSLIDEVGNNENHPLTSLMETIGTLIETIQKTHGTTIEY
jgi:hypothetical protein